MGEDLLDPQQPDFDGMLGSILGAFAPPYERTNIRLGLKALRCLRDPMWRRGHFERFSTLVRQGMLASEATGAKDERIELTVLLAGLLEAAGEWPEVVRIARSVEASAPPALRAELAVYEGAATHNLGRYRAAQTILEGALRGTDPGEGARLRLQHKLHRTLAARGRRREALELLESLLEQVTEDAWFRAEMLLDKAALVRRRSPATALELARSALETYVDLRFPRGVAFASLEAGRALVLLDLEIEAEGCLSQARHLFDTAQYEPGRAHVRIAQGQLKVLIGEPTAAAELFQEAAAIALEANYPSVTVLAAARRLRLLLRAGSLRECIRQAAALTPLIPHLAWQIIRR